MASHLRRLVLAPALLSMFVLGSTSCATPDVPSTDLPSINDEDPLFAIARVSNDTVADALGDDLLHIPLTPERAYEIAQTELDCSLLDKWMIDFVRGAKSPADYEIDMQQASASFQRFVDQWAVGKVGEVTEHVVRRSGLSHGVNSNIQRASEIGAERLNTSSVECTNHTPHHYAVSYEDAARKFLDPGCRRWATVVSVPIPRHLPEVLGRVAQHSPQELKNVYDVLPID